MLLNVYEKMQFDHWTCTNFIMLLWKLDPIHHFIKYSKVVTFSSLKSKHMKLQHLMEGHLQPDSGFCTSIMPLMIFHQERKTSQHYEFYLRFTYNPVVQISTFTWSECTSFHLIAFCEPQHDQCFRNHCSRTIASDAWIWIFALERCGATNSPNQWSNVWIKNNDIHFYCHSLIFFKWWQNNFSTLAE